MKKINLIFVLLLIISNLAYSHPWKPKHFVIIDTDGGLDDFRAINLMLASPDIRVLAITTSDGVLDARTIYYKLKAFLKDNYHDGILAGANLEGTGTKMDCKAAKLFKWGKDENELEGIPSHLEIIQEVIKHSREKITFVNLGSMNSFNSAYKILRGLPMQVKEVLWASNYNMLNESFNYKGDTTAWQSFTEVNPHIKLINGTIKDFDLKNFTYPDNGIKNIYANNFIRSFNKTDSPYAKACYDETLVLYLHYPEYFEKDSVNEQILSFNVKTKLDYNILLINILNGNTINQNQVFSHFPMDSSYYSADIKLMMPEALKKYGKPEWVATVMANEMHRHLGTYAVIGTKMGMRAREYFGAGVDEMQIVSWAGSTPPFSCMNDGLQISTGATLGHGLITIKADSLKLPRAEFQYMGRKISISLKEEYRKRIESEIKTLVQVYGLDNSLYWDILRKFALDYWRFWDRHEIFEIQV